MKPGATALHVMLRALYSRATDLVRPITPAWTTSERTRVSAGAAGDPSLCHYMLRALADPHAAADVLGRALAGYVQPKAVVIPQSPEEAVRGAAMAS